MSTSKSQGDDARVNSVRENSILFVFYGKLGLIKDYWWDLNRAVELFTTIF